jgi:hypothetical protein
MTKRHLIALLHRARCDRAVLVPMLDKLTEQEQQALWRLFQNTQDDAKRDGARKGARQPWRHR